MKIRRILLALIISLSFLSLFSCNASNEPEKEEKEEKKEEHVKEKLKSCTVNILLAVDDMPYDATNVEKAINNKLLKDGKPYKIHFEFTSHSSYSITIGDYCKNGYDAAWGHVSTIQSLIEQEIIMTDIQQYIDDYGQDIMSCVPKSAFEQFTNYKTGKLYAIPRNMPTANDRQRMTLRADWMEEAGLSEVRTVDQLDQYLAYCQNKYSETSGFYALMLGNNNIHLLREYCPSYYFPIIDDCCAIYIDIEDPTFEVKCFYQTEAFEAMVAKANEYVQNGYVSTGTIANTQNTFYNGLSAALPSYSVVKMSERIDSFKTINPDTDLYEACFDDEEENPKVEFYAGDNCMVILSQSQNPNEFVDFINWTKNQENHDLVCFGVLGVNYYLDAKGNFTYTNPENPSERIPLNKRYAMYNPYYAYNDVNFQRFSSALSDEYIEMVRTCQTDDENGNPVNYIKSPLCGFNIQETTAYKTAYNKVTTSFSIFEYLANGKGDVSEIQNLIKSVKDNGIDDLIAEVQRQVDEYVEYKGLGKK